MATGYRTARAAEVARTRKRKTRRISVENQRPRVAILRLGDDFEFAFEPLKLAAWCPVHAFE